MSCLKKVADANPKPNKVPILRLFHWETTEIEVLGLNLHPHFLLTMATYEAQVIAFNNAGVEYLNQRKPAEACDLFKAALEVQLANQKAEDLSVARKGVARASGRVEVAIRHLRNLGKDSAPNISAGYETASYQSSWMDPADNATETIAVYKPFLYEKPFAIVDSVATRTRSRTRSYHESMATMHSAVVIFNLALVHHLYSRSSLHAIEFYKLAATISDGEQMGTLGAALINNIGVWCSENGDLDGAQRCMDSLSYIVQQYSHPAVTTEHDGFLLNVRWLLSPPLSASPAA